MDEFKNYKRSLIQIARDTVVLLHIFEKDEVHSLEEMVLDDCEAYYRSINELRKEAAEQFIKQFEGNECVAFIKALKDECEAYLTRNEERLRKFNDKYENMCSE